jgi:hypothetical protein
MMRQVGLAIGVAVLVAVLGTPDSSNVVTAFRQGWTVIAAVAALTALVGLTTLPVILRRRTATAAPAAAGAEVE